MNSQSLRKIIAYLIITLCGGAQTGFAAQAQVPLILQSKLTRLLQRLDTAETLTPELSAESRDLITRFQQLDANNEIQRIQKRLNQFPTTQIITTSNEEETKKTAEEAPLLGVNLEEPVGEQQKELETKKKTILSMPDVARYVQLHGQSAIQRLRSLAPYGVGGMTYLCGVAGPLCLIAPLFVALALPKEELDEIKIPLFLAQISSLPLILGSIYSWGNKISTLYPAIQAGNIEEVRRLLDTYLVGANSIPIQVTGITPLMEAAQYGQAGVARLLLERGADISLKDTQGRDVFDYTRSHPADSPDLRKRRLAVRGAILEHQLKKKEQMRLRGLYEPAEILAAEAIEALHTSLYGTSGIGQAQDISSIVRSYLTPEYVNILRARHTKTPALQKSDEEKKD